MTLAAFATSDDVAVRLGRTFDLSESRQADAFLDDAANQIRDYCRQDFNQQTLSVTFESPDGPWLDLQQRPVTEVTAVRVNGQSVGNYTQVGDRLYRVYGWRWPSVDTIPSLAIYGLMSTVEVDYTAGYNPLPGVVVAVSISAAMRAMDNPTGISKESIDDYTREMPTAGTGVFLTDSEMKSLRRYRQGAFSIDMGSGWA